LKQKLLYHLRIKDDESPLVGKLMLLQFFLGVAFAFCFSSGLYLVLETETAASTLAYVYIVAGPVLLLSGFIYSKLEHLLSTKTLALVVILFLAASTIALIALWSLESPATLGFVVVVAAFVFYQFSNLTFWGLAALLFDVRQSKRLFGVISAGDIPAKLMGFFVAGYIGEHYGTEYILIIAALCYLLALGSWRVLFAGSDVQAKTISHEHHDHHHTPKAASLIAGVFGSPLIFALSLLSIAVVLSTTFISFSFYTEVEEQFHAMVGMKEFVGTFMAIGAVVALLFKFIFTERISHRFGAVGGLLTMPIILLLFSSCVLLFHSFSSNVEQTLYLFGMVYIISESLRVALQLPLFFSLLQPLSPSNRLKGHTLIKGVMDPFGMSLAGIILLWCIQGEEMALIHRVSQLVILAAVLWIALVFLVRRNYMKALAEGLQNRYLNPGDFPILTEQALLMMQNKLTDADEKEALYLLQMSGELRATLVKTALKHPAENVRKAAINLGAESRGSLPLDQVFHLLVEEKSESVIHAALHFIGMHGTEVDVQEMTRKYQLARMAMAALISGALKNEKDSIVQNAQGALDNWCNNEDVELVLIALNVIRSEKPNISGVAQMPLLYHANHKVVASCIQALCSIDSAAAVPALREMLQLPEQKSLILNAVKIGGPCMASLLFEFIASHKNGVENRQLFRFLPCMSKDELQWMNIYENFPEGRRALLYRLYTLGYQVSDAHKSRVEIILEKERTVAIQLCHAVFLLESEKPKSLAQQAMKEDLFICIERMLFLCALLYGHDKIKKVKDNFSGLSGNNQANAHELLQLVIPQKFYAVLIVLLEESNAAKASRRLSGVERASFQTLASLSAKVLDEKEEMAERWCRACFIYSAGDADFGITEAMLLPYTKHAEPILQETAHYCLEKLIGNA